jgi:DNA-binding response OmpR family regulator
MPTEDEYSAAAQDARILVVEDDEGVRSLLLHLLGRDGYQADAAGTYEEARALFQKDVYACALLDLNLPDGRGTDLLPLFSHEDPSLVPIILTGDHSASSVIDTMRAGAFDYLTKPVDSTAVRTSLTRALAHHSVIRERGELFRLLYEEREQLRERVNAATTDIRRHAARCETSNARLRALLHLTQVSNQYYSEEDLMARMFEEVRAHIPLSCIVLCASEENRILGVGSNDSVAAADESEPFFYTESLAHCPDWDPIMFEAQPDQAFQPWVERHVGVGVSHHTPVVFTQDFWNRPTCTAAFFIEEDYKLGAEDREFLDMCSYLLAFEWERAKLLLHVAHQASLGSIAMELVRNFAQPLTAIRMSADFLGEETQNEDTQEGLKLICDNVDRLRRQTQEFRKLSVLRQDSVETVDLEDYVNQAFSMLSVTIQSRNIRVEKDIESPCECLLLNGTALARTFLDLLLGAIRNTEVDGTVWVRLHKRDSDHVAFEMTHSGAVHGRFAESYESVLASTGGDQAHVGLQLAERTVHSCGGTLSVEAGDNNQTTLRIMLPRNATNLRYAGGGANA